MTDQLAYKILFYNLDNGRDPKQVEKELRALCNMDEPDRNKRPALVGLCETTGQDLPDLGGFHKIRDRSSEGRANISAYVRGDLFGGGVTWVDLKTTWSNNQKPGTHWPRSYVRFKLGAMQAIVYHAPPKSADTCTTGQQEGIDSLVDDMKPGKDANDFQRDRPRIAVADWNRRKDESGPGPTMLANKIDGVVKGGKIDAVVKRGDGKIEDLDYPTKVHGVALKSDHGHALRFTLKAAAKYWAVD